MTDNLTKTALKIGETITGGFNDGWIYCETLDAKPFAVAPFDTSPIDWDDAEGHCFRKQARPPLLEEFTALSKYRNAGALRGTFNETAAWPESLYWTITSTLVINGAAACRITDPSHRFPGEFEARLRLVRPLWFAPW